MGEAKESTSAYKPSLQLASARPTFVSGPDLGMAQSSFLDIHSILAGKVTGSLSPYNGS